MSTVSMKSLKQSITRTFKKPRKAAVLSLSLVALILGGTFMVAPEANAQRYRGYSRYDRGYHGNGYGYNGGNRPLVSYKTGKILKGGLVGAGIGAGSAIVFDKPLLKSSVLGAGIGAGVQAIRYW